ncbi:PAS domain-containing protein, partial [Streptomyces klenkii]
IESWVDRHHPDDRALVLPAHEEAVRARRPAEFEYRVRRDDGTYGWVRMRAGMVLDEEGRLVREAGTLWNTTQAHAAAESVSRALRHMTDGFLAVDREWRIEFVNLAAERLLGEPAGATGRLLWDVPAIRGVPGLEERCRRAVAEGRPEGFDAPWPGGDRWYHLRPVPLPDEGLTLYITDVTERRHHEAARRAAAERAALTGQLTRSLAQAVTAEDVVGAVADSVLPAFGAAGLTILGLENDRLNVIGAVGYPEGFRHRIHGLRHDVPSPVREALRTRSAQFVESREAFAAGYPETAAIALTGQKQAWAFLPLTVSGRAIGAAVVSFDRPRTLDDDERALLSALSGL